MEAETSSSGATQGKLWVNVFEELSYSSHAIPPRADYPKTKVRPKTVTRNTSAIINSFENVSEPELCKQLKRFREVAGSRMLHHRAEPQSMATQFCSSGTPQFVVPMVPYYLDFATTCAYGFDPIS